MVKEQPWDLVYPDTEQGAIDCLKAQMSAEMDFTDAHAIIDPQVYGVWKVILPNEPEDDGRSNIVYMKGHKDVWGNKRETNDFETVY